MKLPDATSLTAEVVASREALQYYREKDYNHIIIEFDSLPMVHILNDV